MRISFTTNLCAHYNVGTFEVLSRTYDLDYYFYSAGEEWYWQERHGVQSGNFHFEYLPGFHLGRTRITLALISKLWKGNYDIFIKCINGRFALPVTFLIARLKHKPFILWTGVWTRLQTPAHRLFFPITRYIYTHSDAIVVYGSHTKDYLISEGVPPSKIFVAAHAVKNEAYNREVVEEEKDNLRRRLNIKPDQKVVLYLGRLEEIKGLPFLLHAFQGLNLKETVLVIAGDGALHSSLELLAKRLDIIDQVRFAGYVSPAEAPVFYSLATVFVLPSITVPTGKELWGLVINEAFNQGVPVIASDAVGAAAGGLVQDGVNGFVFPEKDTLALSQLIKQLLIDDELHTKLSLSARKNIASWDYERNVAGYCAAIEYVTRNHTDPSKPS
jgi:glycosyltransferase involved in cell wall biosynthesis